MRAVATLRSGLFFLGLCVITPIFSLVSILICWLPAPVRYHTIGQWNRTVVLLLKVCCGIGHEVGGLANLPKPPYLICSNHQSAWETIAFYCIFPRISFVTKRSLLWIPFFGWGFYLAMDPIPINREAKLSSFKKILKLGRKRLEDNVPVVIFPEGTRLKVGQRRNFMASAFMLAVENKIPIVPVAHNSGRLWPRGMAGFIKRPGTIEVRIGKPIASAGKKTRAVATEVEQSIYAELERIGG